MAKRKDTDKKTNALREIEAAGIEHRAIMFECPEALSGTEIAAKLGQDPDRVFKTLVTQAKSGEHYVFMVPVACELDLKKAAATVGEKSVAMIKARDLLPLTPAAHRLRARGMLPHRHEDAVPYRHRRDGAALRHDHVLRRPHRLPSGNGPRGPRNPNPTNLRRPHRIKP